MTSQCRRPVCMWRRSGIIAASTLLAATTGCSYRSATTGMAVDYNEFVAQTTNRQTVLNILRAREREPMHFTSFSEIVGTVRGTGQVGVNAAVNGDARNVSTMASNTVNSAPSGAATGVATTAADTLLKTKGALNVTPSLTLTIATGTDFKVAANATDEFYKGIITSIPAPVIVSYLRQGFPPELLSHLLIGRLEFSARVTEPGAEPKLIFLTAADNQPDRGSSVDFANAIRCRALDYSEVTDSPKPIEVDDLKSFGALTADQLRRVTWAADAQGGMRYRFTMPEQTTFALALSEPDANECGPTRGLLTGKMADWVAGVTKSRGLVPRSADAAAVPTRAKITQQGREKDAVVSDAETKGVRSTPLQLESAGYFDEFLPIGWKGDLVIGLTIRSVEGVLYYLGEYVRDTDKAPKLDCGAKRTACLPLLRVLPADDVDADRRFVEVGYRGKRYAVPLSGAVLTQAAGRSSQTIDLVQQLLNLNRSAKDLPSTPLVRVYN